MSVFLLDRMIIAATMRPWGRGGIRKPIKKRMGCSPVNIGDFCPFSVGDPADAGDDWIQQVFIKNQYNDILLNSGPYDAHPGGHRDNTEMVVECSPGDILEISVTVNAGGDSWVQALSWGHSIYGDLELVENLRSTAGCPWTHTYTWEVPQCDPGNYLVAWWEHYDAYGLPCGEFDYAERHSYTLCIE